ncbi:hypothetical protein RJ640_028669 [Escallonia rubra]|uniref:Chalcone synthase n=1 Tax=Escallonia rubra TaxID=112253 RepID=A0AA88RQD7_9ASTE|nr:hypothetical protein RJ640_028669 [Escallonia rubra]
MMYQQGCFAGDTVLRLAKDLVENNTGARVLVVYSEITAVTFRGPSDTHLDSLVGQALFDDGDVAVIVGADPDFSVERSLFQLVFAAQTILSDSDGAIYGHLREVGLTFHLLRDVPGLISKNIEKSLKKAFTPFRISDWNSLFWIAHSVAAVGDEDEGVVVLVEVEELDDVGMAGDEAEELVDGVSEEALVDGLAGKRGGGEAAVDDA